MARLFALVAGLAIVAPCAWAQNAAAPAKEAQQETASLKPGDAAPAFAVESFVKGDAITGFEKGKVYIVEFWATWCGPCIRMFPHLSELQKEYKDKGLTIVGVNVWEDKDYNDETINKVKSFVEKQGDRMSYRVAYDGKAKAMDTSFMKASGQNGIPAAFVVGKDTKIAWIGHPMWLDLVLPDVVDGKWDAAKGSERITAAESELQKVMGEKDPKAGAASFEEFAGKYPSVAKQFETMYASMLVRGDSPKAESTLKGMIDKAVAEGNTGRLNEIAWMIADPRNNAATTAARKDMAFGAATKAVDLTKGEDPIILHTLARVQFLKGDTEGAIKNQEKAVGLITGPRKAMFEKALEEYKAAKK